jgi:hypothetical protein
LYTMFIYSNQSKMEEIKKLKEEQERMLKKNKNRKEERDMDKKLDKLELELEELQKQLREKEQENRISTMKIRQYKRTIKQAKLKPMPLPVEEIKKEDERAKTKPVNISKPVINNAKKISQVKKNTTKKETGPTMHDDEKNSKNLGDVKAPPGGKGTFETEVHL